MQRAYPLHCFCRAGVRLLQPYVDSRLSEVEGTFWRALMDCRGFGEISFGRHQYQEQATFASFAVRHLQAQRVMLRSQSPFLRVNPFPSAKTQQPTKNFYSALGRCWPTCSEANYAPRADGSGDLKLTDRYAYRLHNEFCSHGRNRYWQTNCLLRSSQVNSDWICRFRRDRNSSWNSIAQRDVKQSRTRKRDRRPRNHGAP